MATALDLVNKTRNHLMTGKNDRLNTLAASISDSATSFTMTANYRGVVHNSLVSIGIEDMYVLDVSGDTPGSTVSVIRGYNGSTPQAHTIGDVVRCNPQFTDWRIFDAMNDSLRSLSGKGCFYVKAIVIPDYSPAVEGYSFSAADFLAPYRLRTDVPGSANDWPEYGASEFRIDNHPDPTDFPGGMALILRAPGSPGMPLRLSYEASFGTLSSLADDVTTTTGLHPQGHELLSLDAAIRCLSGREVKRTFMHAQPEPRRQEEVPPGATSQAIAPLIGARDEALNDYLRYLHKLYPKQVY